MKDIGPLFLISSVAANRDALRMRSPGPSLHFLPAYYIWFVHVKPDEGQEEWKEGKKHKICVFNL